MPPLGSSEGPFLLPSEVALWLASSLIRIVESGSLSWWLSGGMLAGLLAVVQRQSSGYGEHFSYVDIKFAPEGEAGRLQHTAGTWCQKGVASH